MASEYSTATVYVSYALYMNPMRGRNEDAEFVMRFPSIDAARQFYNEQLAEKPYREEYFNKCFLKGSPFEYYNKFYDDDWWDGLDFYGQGLIKEFTEHNPGEGSGDGKDDE